MEFILVKSKPLTKTCPDSSDSVLLKIIIFFFFFKFKDNFFACIHLTTKCNSKFRKSRRILGLGYQKKMFESSAKCRNERPVDEFMKSFI